MASFNKVVLMGNLTRDPQMKYLPSQTPVVDFGMAINRRFKTQAGEEREETTFVDCSAFGRQAEVIHQWCAKGKQLLVEGRLKYDTWDDKNSGGKRSKLSVIVESFQFVNGRDGVGASGSRGTGQSELEEAAPPRQRSGDAQAGGQMTLDSAATARAPTASPIGERPVFTEADIPF